MSFETTNSINKTARIAGLLYLLLAIFGLLLLWQVVAPLVG